MDSSTSLLTVCRKALAIESSRVVGNKLIGEFLKETFSDFKWSEVTVHGGNSLFYTETNPQKNKIDILCYSNLDTGTPGHLSLWDETEFDPLNPVVKKGKLFGLGASNVKLSIFPQLKALIDTSKESLSDKNIVIVGGFGRESNMRGAKRALRDLVKKREVDRLFVSHPTGSCLSRGSIGRLKMRVFFPFTEDEKNYRKEHDLKENNLSQSRIFSSEDASAINANSIYKLIESTQLLPEGTLVLDLEGGTSYTTEPESTFFEIDFEPKLKQSVVQKLKKFSDLILKINDGLLDGFVNKDLKRAIHIGRCMDNEEGLTFYGYCLFPSNIETPQLDEWLNEFKKNVEEVGGEVKVMDLQAPVLLNNSSDFLNQKYVNDLISLNSTEASFFAHHFPNVYIFGPGDEDLSKKPNENVDLHDLSLSYDFYKEVFSGVIFK